jgi:hypothetical protein
MNKVQFEEMFPWDISRAMADTPIVYPPLGTLDWHGEHNAVGLDGFKTNNSLRTHYANQPEHLQYRRETAHKYIGVLRGIDDTSNDPELTASTERGHFLFEVIAYRVAERTRALLAENPKTDQ